MFQKGVYKSGITKNPTIWENIDYISYNIHIFQIILCIVTISFSWNNIYAIVLQIFAIFGIFISRKVNRDKKFCSIIEYDCVLQIEAETQTEENIFIYSTEFPEVKIEE